MGDFTLFLKRIGRTDDATFGVLVIKGEPFALTMEPAWKDNRPNVSCIPDGEYLCKSVNSPRFGFTYEVINVPGRTHILFHKGNAAVHTKGCILVGEQFARLTDTDLPGILASRKGYMEFMYRLRGIDTFPLTIQDKL